MTLLIGPSWPIPYQMTVDSYYKCYFCLNLFNFFILYVLFTAMAHTLFLYVTNHYFATLDCFGVLSSENECTSEKVELTVWGRNWDLGSETRRTLLQIIQDKTLRCYAIHAMVDVEMNGWCPEFYICISSHSSFEKLVVFHQLPFMMCLSFMQEHIKNWVRMEYVRYGMALKVY